MTRPGDGAYPAGPCRSAAALPVPRPPGRSRAGACRLCCTKCGPFARPQRTRPTTSPSWSAPIRSAPTTRRQAPSASCMPRCAGSARWSCARPTRISCRPAARSRSTATVLPPRSPRRWRRTAHRIAARKSRRRRPDWDSVIVATGPLTSSDTCRRDPHAHRRRRARFLRCHRADRASRVHRLRHRLVPVALRQDRARRLRRRLHQLPADARAIRRLRRCAARRRENGIPRFRGVDALFRRLPADRGDGRARARDAPPWTDEAVRPDRSASAVGKSPTPSCNCARTTSSARCSTWSGFQTKLKHGEQVRIFRTIPGLANAEFARLGGLHRNTFLNSPKLLDDTLRLKANAALRFRRPDHRLRRLRGIGGDRSARRPLCRRRAARRSAPASAAADHRAWRPPRSHHRRSYRNDRRRTTRSSR